MTRARLWAAIAFGQPVTLTPEQASRMLNMVRAAVVEASMPAEQAARLARAILAATPGSRELFGTHSAATAAGGTNA